VLNDDNEYVDDVDDDKPDDACDDDDSHIDINNTLTLYVQTWLGRCFGDRGPQMTTNTTPMKNDTLDTTDDTQGRD